MYHARVSDLRLDISLSDDYHFATIDATAEIESVSRTLPQLHAQFHVMLDGKLVSATNCVADKDGKASIKLPILRPELWMPNGYGKQSLYTVSVTIASDKIPLHTTSRRVGLRKIELVQDDDAHGKSFYFRVNGVDIFCGGSCWIPADSFLTNVTPERYRAWIELMVPANQKMIR